jgi:DNA-binding MarR family transcriptional regulator
VTPAIIGAVTLIAEQPGISQAQLARLIGLERATVGATVARGIAAGLIRRDDARHDARRYVLSLTPRGQKMLGALRRRIATHETQVGGHLTPAERRMLRTLLHKLIYAA